MNALEYEAKSLKFEQRIEEQAVLGSKFNGIGVLDDYGAYKSLFEEHQLSTA